MKHQHLSFDPDFDVVLETPTAQAAIMTLGPSESTGGPDNRHEASDQWLFVVSGEGQAVVEGKTLELAPGTLLVIEAGEAHGIRCTSQDALRTLNVYVPPEY